MFPREPPSSLEVGQRRGRRACRSRPAVQGGSADGATLPADPLRGRLMVGRLTLDQEVGVRVPAPQLRRFRPGRTDCKPGERKGGGSRRVRTGPRTEGSRLRRIDANHSFELGRVAYHCRYSPCLRLRLRGPRSWPTATSQPPSSRLVLPCASPSPTERAAPSPPASPVRARLRGVRARPGPSPSAL